MLTAIALIGALASARQGTEVTVYNNNFALIKEQRTIPLVKGVNSVTAEGVAAQIEANSVGVRALGGFKDFEVLEQNYRYDIIGTQSILQRSVGQKITLNLRMPDGKIAVVHGTLLSPPTTTVSDANGNQSTVDNGMVVKTDGGEILLNPEGTVSVDTLPDGLVSQPSLLWKIESAAESNAEIELSYLTKGISWKSDYVLSLDQDGKIGELKGWVTLNNQCGTGFENATLKLLAGEVNRVESNKPADMLMEKAAAPAATAVAMPKEEQFGEYHLYTVQRPVTLANNEIKQVSLLDGHEIKVTRTLLFEDMSDGSGEDSTGTSEGEPVHPSVFVQIVNKKDNGLGIPLPAGTFKVFQQSASGSLEMLGEDSIVHTPKEETLKLHVGQAFDVVGTKKRTSFRRISKHETQSSYVITIRNHKDTDAVATIWESTEGDHKLLHSEPAGKWLDSTSLEFVVNVPANGSKTITYTIDEKS